MLPWHATNDLDDPDIQLAQRLPLHVDEKPARAAGT
jgi:hypothetical protein